MSGRPRVLDEIKRREVCALISAGCSMRAAAHYVGCSAITIRREALRNTDFHELLRRAELAAQIKPLQAMQNFAGKYWRAAAWLLERNDPQTFARRNPRQYTPEETTDLIEQMIDEIFQEIDDPALRRRVSTRIYYLSRQYDRANWATKAPRRDLSARRRARHSALYNVPELPTPS